MTIELRKYEIIVLIYVVDIVGSSLLVDREGLVTFLAAVSPNVRVLLRGGTAVRWVYENLSGNLSACMDYALPGRRGG